MKKSQGKGGRSFDSVPADDGFRNYMSRKIELQRKQFGLVLPPSPDSPSDDSSPDTDVDLKPAAPLHNFGSNQPEEQLESSARSTSSDSPSRKSVRFHTNLEQVAPITSVSDVLEKLKQKDSVRKSSLRRRRYGASEKQNGSAAGGQSDNASMKGVLNKLQKRHGSSSKRKRPRSVLETLESANDMMSSQKSASGNHFDETAAATANTLTQIDPLIDSYGTDADNNLHTGVPLKDFDELSNEYSSCHSQPEQQVMSNNPSMQTHEQAGINNDQDTNVAKRRNTRPDLFFSGIVVLINGHTDPDATTLMRLLHKHGGDLEKYETRRVTHIIAERLSTAKANIYKNQKNPTPVCRPEWITDSVRKGKLLPFGDYLLEDVIEAKTPGTKSLKTFFGPEKSAEKEPETPRWADTDPSKSNYHINGQVRTVGNDPNFLESYFSSSRLSYIGSFKQRVKTIDVAASRKVKTGSQRFVLLVDMDCFFASVALKNFPQYKNCPVAVGHSPTVELKNADGTHSKTASPSKTVNNSSSELSTCNYIARKFGVRKGMFLGDAIKLCPHLIVLPYDFPQYESISSEVADTLHLYADQFNGSVEQVSCDESYLEVHVTAQDYKGHSLDDYLKSLAEQIRKDIFACTECTASIGVGCNKFLAKLAADKVKPDASKVVLDHQEILDGLSLRDLHGIGRKIEKKLTADNLHNVNDVWDLGDDAERVLSEVVGIASAQKIVNFCYGKDDRPVQPQVRKTIGAECNYGVRFDGPYGPEHMMNGLSKEVEKRMTSVAVRGSKLTLKIMKSKQPSKMPGKFLGHGLCEHLSKSVDIPLTRSRDVISNHGLKLFQKMAVHKDVIRGMGLVVSSLESDTAAAGVSSPSKLDVWLRTNPTGSAAETMSNFILDQDEDVINPIANNDATKIPTYSQLDQDVLTELPDDILEEVQRTYGKKSTASRATTHPPFRSPKSKHRKPEKHIVIPGQVSVKRMLKLASVKSGEDKLHCANEDFTLSQLGCLPLETQLRIVNNDDVRISKAAAASKRAAVAPRNQHNINDSNFDSDTEGDNNDSLTTACDLFCNSRDFYRENILPLQEFMRSKPFPESEDVDSVIEFLFVCIKENRLEDAIVFLRTIKDMKQGWDELVYDQIKETAVNEIHRLKGYELDTIWLGL